MQQKGLISHPQDLDAPLRLAAQRKINSYRQQYTDNQNLSFLPAIMSTFTRMHGKFLRHWQHMTLFQKVTKKVRGLNIKAQEWGIRPSTGSQPRA